MFLFGGMTKCGLDIGRCCAADVCNVNSQPKCDWRLRSKSVRLSPWGGRGAVCEAVFFKSPLGRNAIAVQNVTLKSKARFVLNLITLVTPYKTANLINPIKTTAQLNIFV